MSDDLYPGIVAFTVAIGILSCIYLRCKHVRKADKAAVLDATKFDATAVSVLTHIDDLDDLCLAAIAHQLPSTRDLILCGKSCARLHAACAHELEHRARGILQYAGMAATLPVDVELESGRGEGILARPYAADDLVGLAASHAGGWGALLAGRELLLETSSPEPATPADYAPPEGTAPPSEEDLPPPVTPSTAAALVIWDLVRTESREMSPAECEAKAAAALPTDELLLVGLERRPELNGQRVHWTGRPASHGRVSVRVDTLSGGAYASSVLAVRPACLRLRSQRAVWSGVLPVLDALGQISCYVHDQRLGGGCAMFPRCEWGARRFTGGARAWRHIFCDGSRGDSFQFSGVLSDEGTAWCVRVSVVAPGCAETLVDAMPFEPSALLQLVVAEPDADLLPAATHIEAHGPATLLRSRRRVADGQYLRATMPPEAQSLPDGPNGAPSSTPATAVGGVDGGEEDREEDREEGEDPATGLFGLTYPMPDDDDSRHVHYFRAYVWMQNHMDSEGEVSDVSYHVDVDLTREDRLWAIDIARGNKAPRLKECR